MRNCKSALCCDFTGCTSLRSNSWPSPFCRPIGYPPTTIFVFLVPVLDTGRRPGTVAPKENAHMVGIPCSPLRSSRTAQRGARRRRAQRGGAAETISEQDAHAIGVQAYLYFYSARHDGPDAKAAHQRRQARGHLRADEHVRQHPGISDGGHEGGGPAELRHALFQRLAGPDQGAGDRIRARYAWALLPAADARHVDRRFRVPGLAHDRNPGRRLCRDAAGLDRLAAGRRRSHRRADALCLDHRPHQDRRTGRLRRREQDSGRAQDHAAVELGQDRRAGRRNRRSRRST